MLSSLPQLHPIAHRIACSRGTADKLLTNINVKSGLLALKRASTAAADCTVRIHLSSCNTCIHGPIRRKTRFSIVWFSAEQSSYTNFGCTYFQSDFVAFDGLATLSNTVQAFVRHDTSRHITDGRQKVAEYNARYT